MSKNDFTVTSIFKIIIGICKKNDKFCRKTSKFLPKKKSVHFLYFFKKKKRERSENSIQNQNHYF